MEQNFTAPDGRIYHNRSQYLVIKLIDTTRRHRAATEKMVDEIGLHRSQHQLLMYLSQHDEFLSQKQIADYFQITPAAIATGLKKLEKDGYITRCVHPDDNRYNTIRITEQGLAVVNKSCELFDRIDIAMFSGLTEEEINTFITLMDKLQDNLSPYLQ